MQIRMKIAKKAKVQGLSELRIFEAGQIYILDDEDLAKVFVAQDWAEEVEGATIDDLSAALPDLEKMDWNDFRDYARSIGIKVSPRDTREAISEKIKEMEPKFALNAGFVASAPASEDTLEGGGEEDTLEGGKDDELNDLEKELSDAVQ